MAATLNEVVQELQLTNEFMGEIHDNVELSVEYLDLTVDVFRNQIGELAEFMRGNRLDELESRREEDTASKSDSVKGEDDFLKDIFDKIKDFVEDAFEFAGIGAGIIAAPFVLIGSFFAELKVQAALLNKFTGGFLAKIFSPFIKLFNALAKSKMITGLVNIWQKKVLPFFSRIGQFFGFIDEAGKAAGSFAKVLNTAARLGSILGRIFLPITALIGIFGAWQGAVDKIENEEGGLVDKIFAGIKGAVIGVADALVGSLVRMAASAVSFIFDLIGLDNFAASIKSQANAVIEGFYAMFGGIIDVVKGIFTFDLNAIKSGISSIFTGWSDVIMSPVQLAYSAIKDLFSFAGIDLPDINFSQIIQDTVEHGFEFLKKQFNFTEGEFPSVTDIATGIMTLPADLVRSAAASVMGMLGFDSIADTLSSFSFSDIYRSIADTMVGLFVGAKDWIVDKFTSFSIGNFVGNVTSKAQDFLKGVLRSVLPDPSKEYGFLDPAGWAAKAIPDGIYEFAGINPQTGESLGSTAGADSVIEAGSSPSRVRAGSQLQRESEARRDVEIQQRGSTPVNGNNGSGNVNVASNVVNNSNTTLQNRPPASSQPDNMSDTMMAAGFAP